MTPIDEAVKQVLQFAKVLVNVSLQISTALSLTLKIVMTRTLICTGIIWDDQIWILIGSNVDTR